MEPRNIGIFLWWKGDVYSQFLPEEQAPFVNDRATYRRWLAFWKDRIAGEATAPSRGKPVSKETAACLDALITTQKGQYILVDSGELLHAVNKREMKSVLASLYAELIAESQPIVTAKQSDIDLRRMCDGLFKQVGVVFPPETEPF